jgi:hypothetical protein
VRRDKAALSNGTVLAIEGFGGSKDKLSTGVRPAAGVKKASIK